MNIMFILFWSWAITGFATFHLNSVGIIRKYSISQDIFLWIVYGPISWIIMLIYLFLAKIAVPLFKKFWNLLGKY